MIMIM